MTPRASSAGSVDVTTPLSSPATRRSSAESPTSSLQALVQPVNPQTSLERVATAHPASQPVAAVVIPPASVVVVVVPETSADVTSNSISSQGAVVARTAPLLRVRLQRRAGAKRCGLLAPGPSRLGVVVA